MLCNEGIAQVKELTFYLRSQNLNIGIIYTSDLVRAVQTAHIIAEALSLAVEERSAFRETNNGYLAGMDNGTALKCYPGVYWSNLDWEEPYPGGESPCQFYNRISEAWLQFKEEIANMNYDVALVTHGGVIHVIQCIERNIKYTNKEKQFPIGYAQMIAVEV